MDKTITVNTDREIDINITIHAPALLSISQNSYCQIVILISLFYPFRYKQVPRFCHQICPFFYSCSNTSEIQPSYACLQLRS